MIRWRALLPTAALALAGCGEHGVAPVSFGGDIMGTTYRVTLARAPAGLDAAALHRRVHARLREIEARLSLWDPASELSRFNASRSTEWFPVAADTRALVAEAQRLQRVSRGAFDVTVGALVELWGFGPSGRPRLPPDEQLHATRVSVGDRLLETRATPPALRKADPLLRIDLGGIAKGHAVDELARLLADEGLRDVLVEVGGELRASGRRAGGGAWRVAVEPPGAHAPRLVLALRDRAVAGSGDYRNAWVAADGVRRSHVIDPRSARPAASGVASATVLAPTATTADALATALLVLPPDEGLAVAARAGLAARLLVRADGRFVERRTPGFPGAGGVELVLQPAPAEAP